MLFAIVTAAARKGFPPTSLSVIYVPVLADWANASGIPRIATLPARCNFTSLREAEIRIEILSFQGCPNADDAFARVEQALQEESARAAVEQVEVDTPEFAQELHFVGSPSVRIDGKDIEPGADARDHGLMCRTYRDGDNTTGVPPLEMVRAAIRASVALRAEPR